MFGRNLFGVIAASGVIAAIGYMLVPRRRNRFALNINRWSTPLRNVMNVVNMGRTLLRAVGR